MSRKIAKERIRRLFKLSKKRVEEGNKELASRYLSLAREIGMSYNVSIPSDLQKKICDECSSYLVPGKNCKVRIDSKKEDIKYVCEECGNVDRYGF